MDTFGWACGTSFSFTTTPPKSDPPAPLLLRALFRRAAQLPPQEGTKVLQEVCCPMAHVFNVPLQHHTHFTILPLQRSFWRAPCYGKTWRPQLPVRMLSYQHPWPFHLLPGYLLHRHTAHIIIPDTFVHCLVPYFQNNASFTPVQVCVSRRFRTLV